MGATDSQKHRRSRWAVWLLPAILVLTILLVLLIVGDGEVLSALGYRSF